METVDSRLTRIGVFYDGNFFWHVSTYYNYVHWRRARLDIKGLHEFIRNRVSKSEDVDPQYCQIVDVHYFRGRFSAHQAQARQALMADRQWDDVLMREGVITHYLPMTSRGEKGIDVWLALEAFELAIYKRYNVCVLIAGDGDFVPLARKLNTLGARVMVLGWDFSYPDEEGGAPHTTKTSADLLKEVTYPVHMHTIIDDETGRDDPVINNLFLQKKDIASIAVAPQSEPTASADAAAGAAASVVAASGPTNRGTIQLLKEGWGFISPDDGAANIFFHWRDLTNRDFSDLRCGEKVEFALGHNDKGPICKEIVVLEATSSA
jgi:cold shock CspA family protein/uncharacterized LabA/DUF88 family protein